MLEGINSRLDDKEEQISDLEDKVVEITQTEQKKKIFLKNFLKSIVLKTSGTIPSILILALQES